MPMRTRAGDVRTVFLLVAVSIMLKVIDANEDAGPLG